MVLSQISSITDILKDFANVIIQSKVNNYCMTFGKAVSRYIVNTETKANTKIKRLFKVAMTYERKYQRKSRSGGTHEKEMQANLDACIIKAKQKIAFNLFQIEALKMLAIKSLEEEVIVALDENWYIVLIPLSAIQREKIEEMGNILNTFMGH